MRAKKYDFEYNRILFLISQLKKTIIFSKSFNILNHTMDHTCVICEKTVRSWLETLMLEYECFKSLVLVLFILWDQFCTYVILNLVGL